MFDPTEIYRGLTKSGDNWADKNGAALVLESIVKTAFSQCVLNYRANKHPAGECEHRARVDPQYVKTLNDAIEARTTANKARVKYDAAKALSDAMRTAEATHRAASKAAPM